MLVAFIILITITNMMSIARQPIYAESEVEVIDTKDDGDFDLKEFASKSEECQLQHATFKKDPNKLYCNATYDQFLCWPPAKAGESVFQNCPAEVPLVDPSSGNVKLIRLLNRNEVEDKAVRHCGPDGYWLDSNNESSHRGWTDYIKCFPVYLRELMENVSKTKDGNNEEETDDDKYFVAACIRVLEFLGNALSITSLLIGIAVFKTFRVLRNKRTKIHLHLFTIILCQCLITTSIYIDQETLDLMKRSEWICKVMYLTVEYMTTNGFSFMFIEGLLLWSTVNANALRPGISYRKCIFFGYSWPIVNMIIWIIVASARYEGNVNNFCWFGYNLDKIYWILQGPRLLIIIVNCLFLLHVVTIVFSKTSGNVPSEVERVKKALQATLCLMPLLGITNFLSMTTAPIRGATMKFATWAFFAYVFRSFQGLLIVYLYCYRNAEVQEVVINYSQDRWGGGVIGNALLARLRATATETEFEMTRREGNPVRLVPPQPETTEVIVHEPVSETRIAMPSTVPQPECSEVAIRAPDTQEETIVEMSAVEKAKTPSPTNQVTIEMPEDDDIVGQ